MTTHDIKKKPFIVCGHRGYAGKYPENTMTGFVAAAELGVDMIELDVVMSRDGIPVISHDYELDRTSDGKGLFADYTLEELRRYDYAAKSDKAVCPERLCTFEDVCLLLKKYPELMLNIDMKNDEGPICNKVADIVEKYGYHDRVIFNGLGGSGLAQMADRGFYVEASPDGFYGMANFDKLFNENCAKAKALCFNANQHVTKENVERLKDRYGVEVWAWCSNWDGYSTDDNGIKQPVQCEACMENMIRCGVTMALCNYPDAAIAYLKRKGIR